MSGDLMQSCVQNAMTLLQDYPSLQEYIRTFDSPDGFLWTVETDNQRATLQNQMNDLLYNENHSGASFAIMLRGVQQLLQVEQLLQN